MYRGTLKALAIAVLLLLVATASVALIYRSRSHDTANAGRQASIVDKAAGAQLIFVSDRDGDDDVYAFDAASRRMAALTRNEADDSVIVPRRGRWLGVVRGLDDHLFLIRRDGRRQRFVAAGVAVDIDRPSEGAATFSQDGRRLAFREDRETWRAIRTGVVSVPNGRIRRFIGIEPLAFSPNGRLLAFRDERTNNLGAIDVARGSRSIVPRSGGLFVGWSPDSTRIAFINKGALFVADAEKVVAARMVFRGNAVDAHWLGNARLGLQNRDTSGAGLQTQIAVAGAADGKLRVVFRGTGNVSGVWWSPRGDHVAYTTGDYGLEELHIGSLDEGRSATVFRGAEVGAEWSPSGRLLAVTGSEPGRAMRELRVSDVQGKVHVRARGVGLWVAFHGSATEAWSPNERWLAVLSGRGVGIVTLASRNLQWVWPSFVEKMIWVSGSLPKQAPAPRSPRPQVATARQLRSRGRIFEIASDAARLAVLVDRSHVDCGHVVGWTGGELAVVRFSAPSPCNDFIEGEDMDRFGLAVAGTKITWQGRGCGNECYAFDCSADFRHPYEEDCREAGSVPRGALPPRPAPPREIHQGVGVEARRGGAITLRRSSDGRTRTIRLPGGVVDAELEDEGLFYAYNTRADFRGRVVFVPFGELFR